MISSWQDIRYATRKLRTSPAFTVTAILTLGLGLGAAATMYEVVHDVLTAPLPYHNAQELVGVAWTFPEQKPNDEQAGLTADFLQQHARSFSSLGLAEDGNTGVNLSFSAGSVSPAQVHARHASAAYLRTLASAPLLGHTFTNDEDLPHGPHVAVLSYALWKSSFHEDKTIVGRTIRLDEEPYTVVGVMPDDFHDPSTAEPTQLWEALQLSPQDPGYDGDNYQLIGRLRPGVSVAAAQAEISTLDGPLHQQNPYLRSWTNSAKHTHVYRVWPLAQVWTSNVRASLLTMAAAVGAVLLIACLNLAGLMTTRSGERAQELAVRRALGASRARLLQVLLGEGLVLALSSAALAIICARLLTPALITASPLMLPLLRSSRIWETSLFLLVVSLAACALFSLLPAWHALGSPTAAAMPGRGSAGMDRSRARLGRALVIAQVALATVLVSLASLLMSTFLKLQSTSPGFVPQHLVVAQVTMKGANYETTLHKTQFIDKVMQRLQHAPGVSRIAAIDGIPLDRGLNLGMFPVGQRGLSQTAELRPSTPEYFRTMGLSLLSGRGFTENDNAHAPAVAVVNEAAARQWWPGQSPIGQRVSTQGQDPIVMEVIGVVTNTRANSLAEPHSVMIYMPYTQMPDSLTKMINTWIATSFVIRTSDDAPIAKMVEQAVSDADPSMPIAKISSMQGVIDETTAAPRFLSWLAGSFAGFALLLTVLGLFGLLSYQVMQRRRELGLRLALGATRAHLLSSVMQRGIALTCAGLVVGLFASLAVPRLVGSVLGDIIYTGDAPIATVLGGSGTAVALSALAILLAAVIASYLPARRAAGVDPAEVLRAE